MNIRTGLFLYVRYEDIGKKEREGWMVIGNLGLPHSNYSVLMWRCDCIHM